MAIPNNTLSGAYLLSDLSTINAYVTANRNVLSGATIYVISDAGNRQVNIGISHYILS